MLKKFKIEQFVIIDKLELDFQSGLTILTGETGAGKSILLDALGYILGEDANPDSIRAGATESIFEATFNPIPTHPVWSVLMQNGLVSKPGGEFMVYRTLKSSGGGDIRLNGKPIDDETLKKIGVTIVEIHGQFANQSIMDPQNQLTWLDLSGAFPKEVFTNVIDALRDVNRFTQELEDENVFLARHKGRELIRLQGIGKEFDKIGMKKNFHIEAKEEYARLLTAKETMEAFQAILGQLVSANGVVVSLSTANKILARQQNVDKEKVARLGQLLESSLANARDAVTEMGLVSPEYEIDTAPLYRFQEILNTMNKICKDNKITFEDLSDYYEEVTGKLERVARGQETIKRLQESLIQAKNNYRHHAHILSEKRKVAGKALSEAITKELAPIKLLKAEFVVDVVENVNMPWTERGLNEVTFTARMNPGMPFSPISETASGGELARLILALKVVLQRVQATPTLVFDEIDTGIGGAAAAAVGDRIALLADTTQVLVITHSPQVASRGHQHLYISKKTDGASTTSQVRELSMDQRIEEVSRMLAGEKLTQESNAAAQSLINEAKEAAIVRKQMAEQAAQLAAQEAMTPAPPTPPAPTETPAA